jgi:transposase
LKPWLKEQWCIPPHQSAQFVCKMEDVLDVYHRPYDPKRPLVCVDEKSKQLIADARPPLPPRPGDVAKEDYEYVRHGTVNLFVAFEPLANWRRVDVTERRTKVDFARFIKSLVDGRYRDAEKIVLVMDNLNTHSAASLYEAFEPAEAKRLADKLEIHYTPKHGSWLNMAEIELSVLSREIAGRIGQRSTLEQVIGTGVARRNDAGKSVDWRFTTADARIKLKRLYPLIEER